MGVGAQEQRTVGALFGAILADGLGDGQDVVPVERRVQTRPAVTRRSEDHPLIGDGDVGVQVLVRRDNGVDVDEITGLSRLSCAWIHVVIEPDSAMDGIMGTAAKRPPDAAAGRTRWRRRPPNPATVPRG